MRVGEHSFQGSAGAMGVTIRIAIGVTVGVRGSRDIGVGIAVSMGLGVAVVMRVAVVTRFLGLRLELLFGAFFLLAKGVVPLINGDTLLQ